MMKQRSINYLFLTVLITISFTGLAQDKKKIDSLQNLIKLTPDSVTKVSALISLSEEYQGIKSKEAFDYGFKAFTLSQKINDPKSIGRAHNNLGDMYWYKADYASSHYHYFQALKSFEKTKDRAAIANCNRNIGWTYYDQKNYEEALNYYNKSLAVNIELNKKREVAVNYCDLGILYSEIKKYDKALEYYYKSLKIREELGEKENATLYHNIGMVYYRLKNYFLAIQNVKRSIDIADKSDYKEPVSFYNKSIGSIYIDMGKYEDADIALKKSIDYAKKIDDKTIIQECYELFAKLHEKKQDFKKAFEYKELYINIKDTIDSENNSRQINEMTAQYESEKKEMTISTLEKDKALSNEKLEKEKNFKIYLLIFCLMIIALAFVLFRGNLVKKKANKELSYAYKEIEVKNKDITDSINYSKRIQDAILPSLDLKQKLFPDSFLLFKPKDIVSGDFYWFTEKNGKRLIAACDCTGHGVPGALMSMIGSNILHQIVNEKGITSAAEVLNQLHREIRKSLKQDEQTESRDGMDISIVTFNSETEIEFAGAQRPLWIIRNNSLEEIKPDKFSIGGFQTEDNRIFTNHKKNLVKGDCIYIFSDGFADQFGGKEGKKFMSKQFKDLLITNSNKPMIEQENILNITIETWRGRNEQIDDILVIGIRV